MTLGAAAKRTNIPRHYLAAIEEGRYNDLPGMVYGKSFVRVYGALLKLSVAPLLRAFVDEYTAVNAARRSALPIATPPARFSITPFRVRMTLASILLLVLAVYFGGEVVAFVRPPHLAVESPNDQLTTTAPTVRVAGSVDSRASLTINDRIVNNDKGYFSASIPLAQGVNTLTIRAFRRHGREHTAQRTVIRNPSEISQR